MKTLNPTKLVLGALLALLSLTAFASMPAQAQSGWQVDHYECAGATQSTLNGKTQSYSWPVNLGTYYPNYPDFGYFDTDTPCQSIGTISAVCVWHGSGQAPDQLSVVINSYAATCLLFFPPVGPDPDDGFQDPPTLDDTAYGVYKVSTGVHVVQISNPGHSTTVKTTLYSLSASCNGNVEVSFQASVGNGGNVQAWSTHCAPALGGSDPNFDPTNPQYFSGTGCQATGNAVALSGSVSHAQLCIGENGGDTVVKEYFAPTTTGTPGVSSGPLNVLFDSTHFKDQTKITITLKVWDTNGGYYDVKVEAPAYNKAYVLVNGGSPVTAPNGRTMQVNDFPSGDQALQDVKDSMTRMKQLVIPSKTATKSEILAGILSKSVFYIKTHGDYGHAPFIINGKDEVYPAGVYMSDCTFYAAIPPNDDPNIAAKLIGDYEVAPEILARNTQFIPPYNYVQVDACQSAGNDPYIATGMADAFGVKTRADAAFLGYGSDINGDLNDEQFAARVLQNMANQQTLEDAVVNSLNVHTLSHGNGENAPLAPSVTIIGDWRMRLHGIFSGVAGNWFKPL